jgi:signal transduction histidine kinase
MGLGLMICQTLVEANSGRIWRLDDIAPGTAFRFCLPVAVASDDALPLVA